MKILNLTQHNATPAQVEAGVYEPECKSAVQRQLTFLDLPSADDIESRVAFLASTAVYEGAGAAMIGGAPYLMPTLHEALEAVGVTPLYAFSTRESIEEPGPDGSVVKRTVFKHRGFVGL